MASPMAERPPINEPQTGLEMNLPARAENVAVVRHALAGLAEELGMDEAGVADLKTVVTEACMNVAVHAYEGRPGAMYVEAYPDEDGLTVTVRDSGVGIRPRPETEPTSLRLGLSLIAALSSNFVFSGGLNRGTEIRMHLPLHGGGADVGGPPVEVPEDNEETEISIGRTDLLAPVLARVVGALAARQDVSIDRLSDAVLVTDALSDVAPGHFARRPRPTRPRRQHRRRGVATRPDGTGGGRGDPPSVGTPRDRRLCWTASPTTSRCGPGRTATTWRSASARPLLLPDLLADLCERPPQDPRDVHLRVADAVGDL